MRERNVYKWKMFGEFFIIYFEGLVNSMNQNVGHYSLGYCISVLFFWENAFEWGFFLSLGASLINETVMQKIRNSANNKFATCYF